MRSSRVKTLLIAGLGLIWAGTLNAAWEFDSISSPSRLTGPNAQSVLDVYRTLQRMMERWNAHDLEGYLDYFWKSPDLLAVSDAQQFSGWQELHDEYLRSFHNPDEMGQAAQSRIQIRMIRPDLAQALNYWTISLIGSKGVTVGIDTLYLQRFDVGGRLSAYTPPTQSYSLWPPRGVRGATFGAVFARMFFGIVSNSAIYLESCPNEVAARRWQGHCEVKGN